MRVGFTENWVKEFFKENVKSSVMDASPTVPADAPHILNEMFIGLLNTVDSSAALNFAWMVGEMPVLTKQKLVSGFTKLVNNDFGHVSSGVPGTLNEKSFGVAATPAQSRALHEIKQSDKIKRDFIGTIWEALPPSYKTRLAHFKPQTIQPTPVLSRPFLQSHTAT